MPRDQVFISYSHKDREWLDRLQTMLKPLVRKNGVSVWDDTNIKASEKWKDKIEGALASAKVAVLLVSPNFLDSDFIAEHELPPLLEVAKKEGVVILWVYVSSCLFEETEIKDYQAAHDISKPITDKLLRPPRESLRREIEKMDEQINDVFIWTFFGPAIATAFFIVATPSLKPLGDSVILVAPFFATVAIVFSLLVWKLIHLIKRRRAYRLGFVGERAVAEELNQLMLEGCHVFHDVPMEPYGNVDHVIVARTGIYAVETKTAAKKKGQ
jgi:TIR domain/Nuclease-related domain